MPVVCCLCNASGRCKNCSCKKSGRECSNCLPLVRCENYRLALANGACGSTTMGSSNDEEADELGDRITQCLPMDMNMVDQTMLQPIPEIHDTPMPFISQTQPETQLCLEQDVEDLPSLTLVPEAEFRWGEIEDGRNFACALNRVHVYDEIVKWKRNLFKVPSGKAGKTFVRELSRMFNAYV